MEQIFKLIVDNLIGIACAGLAAYAAKTLSRILKNMQGVMTAEKVNCREKIRRFGEFYITTDQITVEEYDDLKEIYDAYHALGGNGTMTELVERCKDLPVVPVRTIRNPYYTNENGIEPGK